MAASLPCPERIARGGAGRGLVSALTCAAALLSVRASGAQVASAGRSAPIAPEGSVPSAGHPAPIVPENSAPHIAISGLIHADAVLYRGSSRDEVDPSTGEPLNESRFLLRRAQLRADMERGPVSGALEIEGTTVGGPTLRVFGAEASFSWPPRSPSPQEGRLWTSLTIGLFSPPFGYEITQTNRERHFLERSNTARAFFPGNRDLGARFLLQYRFLRLSLAAMNGDPIGECQFPGRDPNESRDLLGRVGLEAELAPRVRLQGGFSALIGKGFHQGTSSTKDVLVWRDANENGIVEITEVQVIAGAAAAPSENFDRFALAGDLRAVFDLPRLGELSIYGELVAANNLDRGLFLADPVSAGRDLRELGWYIGFTQELTRYAMIGVRYDRYNPDLDARGQQAAELVPEDSSVATLAVSAALRYAPGRLIVEYDHNTNTLGRTSSGAPTTMRDDAFTVRGEVVF